MDFSGKMRELVRKGATVDVVASSFGLDASELPQEWLMFFANMVLFSCSQQALLERMDSSLGEMKDEMGSKMDSLNSQVEALNSAISIL